MPKYKMEVAFTITQEVEIFAESQEDAEAILENYPLDYFGDFTGDDICVDIGDVEVIDYDEAYYDHYEEDIRQSR